MRKNVFTILFIMNLLSLSFITLANTEIGKKLYLEKCASCHHENRIGFSGPPLMPLTLEKLKDEKIYKIIKEGIPNTLMEGNPKLTEDEIKSITAFIKTESIVVWNKSHIEKSQTLFPVKNLNIELKDPQNLTTVVERGQNKIWLMEDLKILDKFEFPDVHGGIKYNRDYSRFYIPSRAGFIGAYDLKNGHEKTIRACVSLRNITTSNDNKYLVASCLLPQTLVILDQQNFKVKKILPLKGKISGVYTFINENKALFTYRDQNILGVLDLSKLTITYKNIPMPIEDFFIDPLDKFLVGSSKNGEKFVVYDLEKNKVVFEEDINGMPHLSSAAYWYDQGEFYFATFHIKSNFITVWKMYDWKLVKKIEVGGNGFFVKTHPKSNHLWVDKGDDELVLVDKKSFEIKKIKPLPGKKFTHTEFSKDGRYAYLSIFDKNGQLLIYDTIMHTELARFDNSLPVGKYNVFNKEREFLPVSLGSSVFTAKCWGCHHETSMAFGPSFAKIASTRDAQMIRTHLDNPRINAVNLGYKNPTMPNIPLSETEKDMVTMYVKSFKKRLIPISLYNMAQHQLDKPERIAKTCDDYITWTKLGFSPFKEIDKKNEEIFKEICL